MQRHESVDSIILFIICAEDLKESMPEPNITVDSTWEGFLLLIEQGGKEENIVNCQSLNAIKVF